MLSFRNFGVFVAMLAALAIALPASAGVSEMEREELIQRSKLIFAGSVATTKSRWNARGNTIVTDVTFEVDDVLHGATSS